MLRLKGFCGLGGDASYLRPRWIVLRAVGLVYVLIFAGIIAASQPLIGPHGIYPIADFFGRMQKAYPGSIEPFLLAPSLFWAGNGRSAIVALEWTGLAAAVALVLNLWPRMALFACWLVFLSFYSAFGVFAPAQLDILMLETALLCIPFAPAGFRPGLGAQSPPRPIAVFMMRWLLFRVMFESGLVKFIGGDPHWRNFTAMDIMYETAPFPTILGYLDHQMPHAYHVFEFAFTFVAELAAPLLAVFGGRRGRWFAFAVWVVFQAGIELTCNFGWLNVASVGLGFLLLDDQMIASLRARLGTQRTVSPPQAASGPRSIPKWSLHGLRAAFGFHFCLTLVCFFMFVRMVRGLPPDGVPQAIAGPENLFSNFHSANAYTLYTKFLPVRDGVELTGSDDGGRTWRAYDYGYISQRVDRICPFIAPWYPRFEATLEETATTEGADPGKSKSSLYREVAAQLIAGNPEVIGLFPSDPFHGHPPTMIRMRYYQLSFTDIEGHRRTGHFWRKQYVGEYRPMMYRDEHGRVVESNLAEGDAALREGNYPGAVAIYEEQYKVGYPPAGLRLANMLTRGVGVAPNPGRAFAIYAELAGKGEFEARNSLGLCYENGIGVPVDYAKAAASYRVAAEHESLGALYNLGALYAKNRVQPADDIEGLTLLREASERAVGGDSLARYVRLDASGYAKRLEGRMTPEAISQAGRQASGRVKGDDPLGSGGSRNQAGS